MLWAGTFLKDLLSNNPDVFVTVAQLGRGVTLANGHFAVFSIWQLN